MHTSRVLPSSFLNQHLGATRTDTSSFFFGLVPVVGVEVRQLHVGPMAASADLFKPRSILVISSCYSQFNPINLTNDERRQCIGLPQKMSALCCGVLCCRGRAHISQENIPPHWRYGPRHSPAITLPRLSVAAADGASESNLRHSALRKE